MTPNSGGDVAGAVADVIASTVTNLLPDYSKLFLIKFPVMQHIIEAQGGKIQAVDPAIGKIWFNVVKKGPGRNTAMGASGMTPIVAPNEQVSEQGFIQLGYNIWAHSITGMELIQAQNEDGRTIDGQRIKNIVKDKPILAMEQLKLDLARQLTTGVAGPKDDPGAPISFVTWNGQKTYSMFNDSFTGVFTFDDPANQTETVFGIAKRGAANGVKEWYNQYGSITSWATNGKQIVNQVYGYATRYGNLDRFDPGPNIMFSSEGMYRNYINTEAGKVRYISREDFKDGAYEATPGVEAVWFDKIMWYLDDSIVTAPNSESVFTGDALKGVAYLINPKTWVCAQFAPGVGPGVNNFGTPKKFDNLFSQVQYFRSATQQFVFNGEIHYSFTLGCVNLKANGAITGGDQA